MTSVGTSRMVRRVTMVAAAIGTLHFLLAIVAWAMGFWVASNGLRSFTSVQWSALWPAVVSVLLLPVFATSFLLALKRVRFSTALLLFGLLTSACAFGFDTSRDRYQIQMLTDRGCVHVYFNWWWWRYDR